MDPVVRKPPRFLWWIVGVTALAGSATHVSTQEPVIGSELAVSNHLLSGAEFRLTLRELIEHGHLLFRANWTDEDGVGRPFTKGTGKPLSDPGRPLNGRRRFNRISGPDANSCAGCHNAPYAIDGGGGDFTTNVFVQAERFDFVTFDRTDTIVTRGSLDEGRRPATLQTVGNMRATPGLFGAGYLEMLARQMTHDLQTVRDSILPGQSKPLVSKGVSFGVLARRADGDWDTAKVEWLPAQSVRRSSGRAKPSLVIRPWHQSGSSISLREFTNTAYNRHHGIQTTERFGVGTDPDDDGVKNEMTRGDVTAVVAFIATLPVPGRVIPNNVDAERAVLSGERAFEQIGCAACHIASLPLERSGWGYSEPGPFNVAGNLQRSSAPLLKIDLTDPALPLPRLRTLKGAARSLEVPAYTDFKRHDITDPLEETSKEPLDMNQPASSPKFLEGNRKFLTRRLWGVANEPPYFHHGLFTTLREAVLAHAGEAQAQRRAFQALSATQQDALLSFLETLQVLPPGTEDLIVDENLRPRFWPPSMIK
jgi:cytochrome c peroxidase